jgi:hypothetical protein
VLPFGIGRYQNPASRRPFADARATDGSDAQTTFAGQRFDLLDLRSGVARRWVKETTRRQASHCP